MPYEALESRGVKYAIRIPANENLERDVAKMVPITSSSMLRAVPEAPHPPLRPPCVQSIIKLRSVEIARLSAPLMSVASPDSNHSYRRLP